ncbi:hypothetical protein HD597_012339 [Nonomuraea thailandensis]|uniref:Uncharacterized protein n=1 Tax=Nonomuraea thailandensis TaxID=1188745 RepID=A0A9X2KA84_9ACTN|nr:hypothetical protein [Nonomuraea thailandensis]MCP2365319.1 hypothetical protein [Nonomuraea thailandensis]
MSVSSAACALTVEKGLRLAERLQDSCQGRWLVVWEPDLCKFEAFPAFDATAIAPVEGTCLREVWCGIIAADDALRVDIAEALQAYPPTVISLLAVGPGAFG